MMFTSTSNSLPLPAPPLSKQKQKNIKNTDADGPSPEITRQKVVEKMLLFPCCWHHRTLHSVSFSWLMSVNFRHRKIELVNFHPPPVMFFFKCLCLESFWTNGEVRTEGPRNHELSWSFLQQIHFDHNTSSPKKYQQTWECSGFHTCKHNRVNQHAWRLHTLGDEEMFPESGVPQGTGDPGKSRAKNPDCHTRHGWTYCTQVETTNCCHLCCVWSSFSASWVKQHEHILFQTCEENHWSAKVLFHKSLNTCLYLSLKWSAVFLHCKY